MSKRAPDPDLAASCLRTRREGGARTGREAARAARPHRPGATPGQAGVGVEELERLAELCDWFDDDVPLPELERAKQLLQGDGAPPRG